jgi:hypothetical protein
MVWTGGIAWNNLFYSLCFYGCIYLEKCQLIPAYAVSGRLSPAVATIVNRNAGLILRQIFYTTLMIV